jgi:hypothetical protein
MTNKIQVTAKNVPANVRSALIERGYADSDVLTIQEAVEEYTAWHLGDKGWGRDIYVAIKTMEALT